MVDQSSSSTSANEIILDDPRQGFKVYGEQFAPSAASLVQQFNEDGIVGLH